MAAAFAVGLVSQPAAADSPSSAVSSVGSASSGTPLTAQDMSDAIPFPLPMIDTPPAPLMDALLRPAQERIGSPGASPGKAPDGAAPQPMSNGTLPPPTIDPSEIVDNGTGIEPQEYGTALHPYTTARVDNRPGNSSRHFPYAAAGKLYFKIGGASYVCSGSLIKRGLVVTAAHCVTEFGGNWYSDWGFAPAQYESNTPYTTWSAIDAYVMSSYKNGTEVCAVPGIVCPNDVAVLVLDSKRYQGSWVYPGQFTGWLGYGWDGYGFTSQDLTLVNQLGYPVSHDNGYIMQRTDSYGFTDPTLSNNTVWGGRQTGGSSGGPEVINLGIRGNLSVAPGTDAAENTVIGVTSWGYTDSAIKQQGASPFTSSNITVLVNAACGAYPDVCN